MGDPVCDSFGLHLFDNMALLALADGCNWGPKPYEASRMACSALLAYLEGKLGEIKTTKQAAFYLVRGFSHVQKKIIEVAVQRGQDQFGAGTTTLLGGILTKISSEEETDIKHKWIFIGLNLGDCKVFRYKKDKQKIQEITEHSRPNESDMSDPGGRLGPANKEGEPDIRNLSIFIQGCDEGDILLALSDGVYDNFDPEFLGYSPSDMDLEETSWSTVDKQKCHDVKLEFRNKLLLEKIMGEKEKNVSNADIVEKLLEHCKSTTKASRTWVKEHPDSRMPNDRTMFKGKMDHSTCCCLVVGAKPEGDQKGTSGGKQKKKKGGKSEDVPNKKGKSKAVSESDESESDVGEQKKRK